MQGEILSIEKKEEKILDEITSFCSECRNKECCPEEDCVLFRIEQIVLEKGQSNEPKEEE